jgi:hypothetical protein
MLGRTAEPAGLAAWVDLLNRGTTAKQVQADILASDEYFAGHGQGNAAGFITGVYHDVLGRSAEDGAVQVWSTVLGSGASRTTVALAILDGLEKAGDDTQNLYQRLLRRPADAPGGNLLMTALEQGATPELGQAVLAASPEYAARV